MGLNISSQNIKNTKAIDNTQGAIAKFGAAVNSQSFDAQSLRNELSKQLSLISHQRINESTGNIEVLEEHKARKNKDFLSLASTDNGKKLDIAV